jgi:hypothetical protein
MDMKSYFYESADVKKQFIDVNESLLRDVVHLFIACFQS